MLKELEMQMDEARKMLNKAMEMLQDGNDNGFALFDEASAKIEEIAQARQNYMKPFLALGN